MPAKDHLVISLLAAGAVVLAIPLTFEMIRLPVTPGLPALAAILLITVAVANLGLGAALLLARRWKIITKIARFGATGAFNTVLDMSILATLTFLSGVYGGPLIAFFNAISFSTSAIVSYFINRNWSFAAEDAATIREFAGFFGVALSSMVLNTALVYALTTHIDPPADINAAQWVAVTKLLGAVFSFAWNFTLFQLVVFRRKASSPSTGNSDHAQTPW